MTVGLQPRGIPLDASVNDRVRPPLFLGHIRGVGARQDSAYPGTFHAIIDNATAGTFDNAGGDGIASGQVHIVGHAVGIAFEIATDPFQLLDTLLRELSALGH